MQLRPAINVGDVVRLSKRGRIKKSYFAGRVMVVDSIEDTILDGRTKIQCSVFHNGNFESKTSFQRRQLWVTGYNVISKKKPTQVNSNTITQKINRNDLNKVLVPRKLIANNDGRSSCYSCNQPTKAITGIIRTYNICQNKSCLMYDS